MFKLLLFQIKNKILQFFDPQLIYYKNSQKKMLTSASIFNNQFYYASKKSKIYNFCSKCGHNVIDFYRKDGSIFLTKCGFCGKQN